MGEKVRGRQSPKIDNIVIANHKQPTSRITSVGRYAFEKTVDADNFGEYSEVMLTQPATIIFAT